MLSFENGGLTWGITPEDVESFIYIWNLLSGRKEDVYLDYRTSTAETNYAQSKINWLEIENKIGKVIHAPYDILVDYRKCPTESSWGKYKFVGKFDFPNNLSAHREAMIEKFKKEGRLSRGDNPAPRVNKFEMIEGKPFFTLEEAFYSDQVGTNLTIDYPFVKSIEANGHKCDTVREWDIAQAGKTQTLPNFENSKLANTIGVAIGVTAQSQDGRHVILRRKRAEKMAVYAGMWHVPFSFALTMRNLSIDEEEMRNLIDPDWGHEFADELGLEFVDFEPPQILAFCRDLARGGKPQFFFEMKSRLNFEELRKKISKKTPEFTGAVQKVTETDTAYSPELVAFTFLKSVSTSENSHQ
jgi:hypothetical protein